METNSPTTVQDRSGGNGSNRERIEQIVTQRSQECAQIEEQIKIGSKQIDDFIENLERLAEGELSAIDAEMKLLVKRRENAESHYASYKKKARDIGEAYSLPRKERLEHLKRLNRLQSSLTAPITKLPVEVLGYIFENYVDMDNTPCALVLIGPVWKRIALSTPKLWRYIMVTNEKSITEEEEWAIGGEIGTVTTYGRYVVCRTTPQVVSIAHLSGTVPLHVSLRVHGSHISISGDPSLPLYELFKGQTSDRLGELEVKLDAHGTNAHPLSLYMKNSDYPLLRNVIIDESGNDWDMTFMRPILASPNLTRITFRSALRQEIATLPGWSSVLHLSFPPSLDPNNLNRFCNQLYNLRTLNGTAKAWPNEDTPAIKFEFLTELALKCEPTYLHRLTLPSLVKLDLSIASEWTPHIPNRYCSWVLPALTELCLTLTSAKGPYLPPQSAVPALKTLTIINRNQCQSLPPEVYPTVRSVQLDGSGSVDFYASAFTACQNAQKVTFVASRYEKKAILNALHLLVDIENSECLYLPFASEFYFGAADAPVFSKARTLPIVKQLLTNRQAVGKPLRVLDVVWSGQRSGQTRLESYVKTRK